MGELGCHNKVRLIRRREAEDVSRDVADVLVRPRCGGGGLSAAGVHIQAGQLGVKATCDRPFRYRAEQISMAASDIQDRYF